MEKKEYANEFNPFTWNLYVSKQEIPEYPSATIAAATAIVPLVLLILFGHLARATRNQT